MCSIVRNGFKIAFVRQHNHWGRFGQGHYFSSASSKSADYPLKLAAGATRVLVLCKVVVGRGYRVNTNMTHLQAPPDGYDSVLGEVGPALNYDETCVYRDDAVLPKYVLCCV